MKFYPLKFDPILKQTLWGGHKLETVFNKPAAGADTGESWEISDVKGSVSVVANGPLAGQSLDSLMREYSACILGPRLSGVYKEKFPLLIKFIDARDDLSVQVHPGDAYARARGQDYGKTEMWYVLDAEKSSVLTAGFKKVINKEEYMKRAENNTIQDVLQPHPVHAGDAFYIPAGRVHAIGRGITLAEVQQTSDTTFRICDYGRKDARGNPRPLHIREAGEVINFADTSAAPLKADKGGVLCKTPYFTVRIAAVDGVYGGNFRAADSFIILMCIEGEMRIAEESLKKGGTILVPHCIKDEVSVSGKGRFLEVSI